MGGKHKQSSRTKNNARPSSSGRSAELLGSSISQFIGFPNGKESSSIISNLSLNTDDFDSSVDVNFQLVLKKMNKKDSTTKLKALQEFAELTQASDVEVIKCILPYWSRLYCALVTDVEHRVREATHNAHHQIVLKAKRNLAPFLKQLAGPWFTSQYDTYPPAASLAIQSFQNAFPPNKLQSAIVFCQDEILLYIYDNLIVQNANTLSNPKVTSAEDAEAKYQRVIISSIQGYTLYLNSVSSEDIKNALDYNEKIVTHQKFWKFAKHKVAPIRAAWYGCILAIHQKAFFLLEKEEMRASLTVFNNLDESEPSVLSSVWEAALLTSTSFPGWFKSVNLEKVVLPKLWKVLKEGGQGNATVIYPNLLPFISQLILMVDANTFFIAFFDNMRTGWKQKSIIASRSETSAAATSFIECLQYVILKKEDNIALCKQLIKTQLIPTLEWCLTASQFYCKMFFNQITHLMQYWDRNHQLSNYEIYTTCFWDNTEILFQTLLLNLEHKYEKNATVDLTHKQVDFLLTLKQTIKTKKQLKVTFDQSAGDVCSADAQNLSIGTGSSYQIALNGLVYKTCTMYFKIIDEKLQKEFIEPLCMLLHNFDSKLFFEHLIQHLTEEDSDINSMYHTYFKKWLNNDILCSKSLISVVFLLFKYINEDEKLNLLNTFSQFTNKDCFTWSISLALSYPNRNDPIILKWLKTEPVSDHLIQIAKKFIMDDCVSESYLLLKQAMLENDDEELLISKKAVLEIVALLHHLMLSPLNYQATLDKCASFAAHISVTLYGENMGLSYGSDLLLGLIALCCNGRIDIDIISKDTLWEVNTAWQDVITNLSRELNPGDFEKLIMQIVDVIKKEILNNEIDFIKFNIIVDFVINFVKCLQKSSPLRIYNFLIKILNCDFIATWKTNIENLCIHGEYLHGRMCCPFEPLKCNVTPITEMNIVKFFAWSGAMAKMINSSLTTNDHDSDETSDEEVVTILDLINDVREDIILDLLCSFTFAVSFIDNYKCVKFCKEIKIIQEKLKSELESVIKSLDQNCITKLENVLISKMDSNNWLWIKSIYLFYSYLYVKPHLEVYDKLIVTQSHESLSRLHLLYVTQIFGKNLLDIDVAVNFKEIEKVIVLRSTLNSETTDTNLANVFNVIMKMWDVNSTFLVSSSDDHDNFKWAQTEFNTETIRFFNTFIKNYSDNEMVINCYWDFIIVSWIQWLEKIVLQKRYYEDIQVASTLLATMDLFVTISSHIKKVQLEKPESNIINEWKDIFAQPVHTSIIQLWSYFIGEYKDKGLCAHLPQMLFLQGFTEVVNHLDHTYIFKLSNGLKWSKLVKQCCSLLINPIYVLQLWSYNMLMVLIPGLIEIDSLAVNTNTPHVKGFIFEQFKEVLLQTQDIVKSLLSEFRLGEDSCTVEPFTDSYTYTFAYFLLWDILLTLCEGASTELRYQYADWLKNEDFLRNSLDNVFKLIPAEILHCNDAKVKPVANLFINKFVVMIDEKLNSDLVEHMACYIYVSALSQLPALVRQWWTGSETKLAHIVERITSTYVSPHLCHQELTDVIKHENNFKNMTIKVHFTVREVIAIYSLDEAQMELIITLPQNYPLGGPDVQCNRQICGTSHRQWLMQLKMCVLHQNGRIWDGLSLWNHNLNKKFDGVEECYICFSVLHQGTYQVPKLSCQTCRKKFHSACLYKWFSTSNKSTCPICRNLF